MGLIWTVVGVVIGLAALLLAWVALARAAPAIRWTEQPLVADGFVLWNTGPSGAVITKATAFDGSTGDEVPAGEAPGIVELDERLGGWRDPYCRGAVLPPQVRMAVTVTTNCELRIKYCASGLLGRLSRAAIRIEGGF